MIQKIFTIRDAKAESFGPPFYKHSHGEAERDFQLLVNDEKSMPNKFPDDFDLYYLGVYNTNDGKFEVLDTPQHLQKAALVKKV